jgi:hypothetical protein
VITKITGIHHVFMSGLEKTQVLLKKPADRFFHRFFRQNRLFKTGFFTENVHFWGSLSVTTQL